MTYVPKITATLSGTDEIGYEVYLHGIYQAKPAKVIAWTQSHITLKQPGYTENPGSRYSGLLTHYQPEVTVYEVLECDAMRLRIRPLLSWEVGRKPTLVRRPNSK